MSTLTRYLTSAFYRLSLFTTSSTSASGPSVPHPRTPRSAQATLGVTHGLILSTSPYLKSSIAIPKISLTPATVDDGADSVSMPLFDDSPTSTISSCSEDTLTTPHGHGQRLLDINDLFSPRSHADSIPPPPSKLVGLGISGVPRRDGKPGNFDGLGLVGMGVHRFNSRNPFISPDERDDDEHEYTSPSPFRVYRRAQDDYDSSEDEHLSETFIRELVFTWETDPQHARSLCTIPECDDEEEREFQLALRKTGYALDESEEEESSSPWSSHTASTSESPSSPATSPLTSTSSTRTSNSSSPNDAENLSSPSPSSSRQTSLPSRPPSRLSLSGKTNHTRLNSSSGVRSSRGLESTRGRGRSVTRGGKTPSEMSSSRRASRAVDEDGGSGFKEVKSEKKSVKTHERKKGGAHARTKSVWRV
ncbi:hypothetical protein H0H93_016399 [Arthromyces matolae]|nr:hypothetical protein H0H93_016399 [Arthromyces matolae]